MIWETLRQFNWIDVFIAILLLRVIYIAIKKGFCVDFFKLLGTIFAIYLSLHYYIASSDFLLNRFSLEIIPVEFMDFLCFIFLALAGYLFFFLVRVAFFRVVKIETVSFLDRWGGLFIGLARAILFVGLVAYALNISSVSYLKGSVIGAYMGKTALGIAPGVYSKLWNGVFSKFMVKEKFNQNVTEAQKQP